MEFAIWIALAIILISVLGWIIHALGVEDPEGSDPLATDSSWLGKGCGCLVLLIVLGFLAMFFMAG